MNFKDLNLRNDFLTETLSFKTYSGQEIKVKKYLPIADKNDLIAIALQKADVDGIYNEILLDVYFHLNMIYLYTDIDFTTEDREDELSLYDMLEKNLIIDSVVALLTEEGEYEDLRNMLVTMRDRKLTYENTAAAVLKRIITDLPKNAAAAKEIVDSFNPEQYKQVADFAAAANGYRNINTQQPVPIEPLDHLPKKKILKVESATKKD